MAFYAMISAKIFNEKRSSLCQKLPHYNRNYFGNGLIKFVRFRILHIMKMHSPLFIVNWAKEKQFFAERDEAGNVLIRKPATAGMETANLLSYRHI